MKKSTGKVQPKKETVRITLPPKPSAAPTIKLPTLPPGGPTGAPELLPRRRAPAGAAAPVAAQRTTTAAPVAPAAQQAQAARPAPVQRAPVPPPRRPARWTPSWPLPPLLPAWRPSAQPFG